MPVTINNDVPGTELTVGSDTALNSIVADVDKIRQSAVASQRVFVVEVMGRDCGYLALMSGLATGAERVYLPEEGITPDDLTSDVRKLAEGFRSGKRLGVVIRSENADPVTAPGSSPRCWRKRETNCSTPVRPFSGTCRRVVILRRSNGSRPPGSPPRASPILPNKKPAAAPAR